ncbi:MAG: hypothetical protein GKR86_02785 [Ilumatobacter sp.]|nr:hypothetical protein [Ilumatobacter sp.]
MSTSKKFLAILALLALVAAACGSGNDGGGDTDERPGQGTHVIPLHWAESRPGGPLSAQTGAATPPSATPTAPMRNGRDAPHPDLLGHSVPRETVGRS